VVDRATGRIWVEVPPAPGLLRFAYQSRLGRLTVGGLINRRWLSAILAWPNRTRWSARKIPGFALRHGIDLYEYRGSPRRRCPLDTSWGQAPTGVWDPAELRWRSFADFFVRTLPEGARPVDPDPGALIAPADCKVRVAPITAEGALTVKGAEYTLAELTGSHPWWPRLTGGWAVIARLSVDDCHHYCHIDNGRLLGRADLPGRLDTVGPGAGALAVLARNQRLVSVMDGERIGPYFQLEVGALTVGRIVDSGQRRFSKGQPKGHFELGGSTIVLLFPPGRVRPDPDILNHSAAGREVRVRLGERIGRVASRPRRPTIDVLPDHAPAAPSRQPGSEPGTLIADPASDRVAGPVSGAPNRMGAKAARLQQLAQAGLPVPPGVVIPPPATVPRTRVGAKHQPVFGPSSGAESAALAAWAAGFPPGTRFAVRSSGLDEDGADRSFAGRYLTLLDVEPDDLAAAVARVRASAADPALAQYAELAPPRPGECRQPGREHGLASDANPWSAQVRDESDGGEPAIPAVLVQPMAEAAASGVVFTSNPVGPVSESVIVVGRGAGAGTDEAAGPVATYWLCGDLGSADVQPGAPALDGPTRRRLLRLARRAARALNTDDAAGPGPTPAADVEFALGPDGRVTLLQVRPVTGTDAAAPPPGPSVVLDNSNIVESYPGVTTPLTASFAGHIYHLVFRSLARRLSSAAEAERRDPQLGAMVAWWGGRMYYQISNWYALLRLAPFERRLVKVWQDMLGVSDRRVTAPPNTLPWARRFLVWAKLAGALATAPRQIESLHQHFERVEAEFRRRFESGRLSRAELGRLFDWLSDQLASRWDVTLINDQYAFVFTGALTGLLRAVRVPDPARRASELISGGRPLVSLEPLAALRALAARVAADPALARRLAGLSTAAQVGAWLARPGPDVAFAAAFAEFIVRYGDRGLGELKLETSTFRSDPSTLVRAVLAWGGGSGPQTGGATVPDATFPAGRTGLSALVGDGASGPQTGEGTVSDAAGSAARTGLSALPWVARPAALWLAGRARRGVEGRGLSRLDRSRLFGLGRALVRSASSELVSAGELDNVDDVFYLTLGEVFAPVADPAGLRARVADRRQELSRVAGLPAYPRVEFSGPLRPRAPAGRALDPCLDGDGEAGGTGAGGIGGGEQRTGQGCGAGRATGRVLVVRGPLTPAQAAGKVLVTDVTDPGWVFTLAAAAGVVSQKGSLLSHSAIVARELGVPFVAALDGATDWLRDGDLVTVDGHSGLVRRLERGPERRQAREPQRPEHAGEEPTR
jgi:pyruvate,water dikinase